MQRLFKKRSFAYNSKIEKPEHVFPLNAGSTKHRFNMLPICEDTDD